MRTVSRMGVLCLVACLAATAAGADFINGGFEDGTFGGWTQDGGYWYGSIGTYTYSGDPGTSAIVGVGNDPLLAEMSVNVPMVYSGNYAARVNDYGGGNHFSTISQATVWTRPHMYFAWSAVLQEPGHVHDEEPHFLISLHDDTADVDLYSILIASDTTPEIFQMVNDWKYSGWQVVDLDIEAAGAVGMKPGMTSPMPFSIQMPAMQSTQVRFSQRKLRLTGSTSRTMAMRLKAMAVQIQGTKAW